MAKPEFFFYGLAGAASLELLKLYDYRGKLHLKIYKDLVRSPLFWCVVSGMLISSGFIAWSINADRESVRIWDVVITGMAARSLIRDVLAAKESNQPTKLGANVSNRISLKEIFS